MFTRYSADAMKSVKVFFLCIMRPSSCQALPISPPPRMCATAYHDAAINQAESIRAES